MSTMDDKRLRTLLGELADEVPTHRSVPPALEARFRRRVAMNSVVIGTMIVALGVGAFATVRALGPNKASIAPLTSSSAATTTPACRAGQLRAIGSMTGAAGSREGYIELHNYSAKTCTLRGTPIIALDLRPDDRAVAGGRRRETRRVASGPARRFGERSQRGPSADPLD